MGTHLVNWIIKDCFLKGLQAIDFIYGDAEYKRFWANKCNSVNRIVIGHGLLGYFATVIFYTIWLISRIEWLRSFYKKLKEKIKAS